MNHHCTADLPTVRFSAIPEDSRPRDVQTAAAQPVKEDRRLARGGGVIIIGVVDARLRTELARSSLINRQETAMTARGYVPVAENLMTEELGRIGLNVTVLV